MRFILPFLTMLGVASSVQVVDIYSQNDLDAVRQQLAKEGGRFASRDLAQYGNHYTMLAYRETTGSSEVHQYEADIFFVQKGDAVLLTGGKMVGSHLQKPGELRGASIEGGEKHPLKTGDIVHIPAGVPHQILVSPGKPISYFVVKVKGQ